MRWCVLLFVQSYQIQGTDKKSLHLSGQENHQAFESSSFRQGSTPFNSRPPATVSAPHREHDQKNSLESKCDYACVDNNRVCGYKTKNVEACKKSTAASSFEHLSWGLFPLGKPRYDIRGTVCNLVLY